MHIEAVAGYTKGYIVNTLTDAWVVKFLYGAIASVGASIYGTHSEIIKLMILLYAADFLLGIAIARRDRAFESQKFFKGAVKLGVY